MSITDTVLRMMGAMIAHDIDCQVVRLFKADTLGAFIAAAEARHKANTFAGPAIGQLMGWAEWSPTAVLPSFIAEAIRLAPDADSRSHLVGGMCAMSLAPFWTTERRRSIGIMTDKVVRFTKSTELYEEAGDAARVILGAYDQALAMVAADPDLNSSPPSEGQE